MRQAGLGFGVEGFEGFPEDYSNAYGDVEGVFGPELGNIKA